MWLWQATALEQLARLLVASLATWRVANILVNEDGPYLWFWRLRARLQVGTKVSYQYRGWDTVRPATLLGGLLECLWCTSVWVGAGTFVLVLTPLWWLLWPFAISAAALWLFERP